MEQEFFGFIADFIGCDVELLTRESVAGDFCDWDSLTNIKLIVALEKKYNIRFSAAHLARSITVGDFYEEFHSLLAH